ncbi:MAG: PfkB family carbohydrate kinase [Methanomassiliicoccaceae archaeon]|jgi:sugar/nucleoside kinase (ribokinase family)|nr:PfkB family carbohydrate kinase [Methanomassiliicoccaceae archaeon]
MGGRHLSPPFLSVYGHITIDQIMAVDEFPPNSVSVNVLSKDMRIGGTGTNIAVTAASLGVPTALCGFVGNDFPKVFTDIITSKGVITDEFITMDGQCTAQALIVNDFNKEQRVFFYQGPQGSASDTNIVLKKNAGMSKYVHFSTGEPDYYINIMRSVKDRDRNIAFDPAQEIHKVWNREKFMTALKLSDIFFCNKYESASALKYTESSSLSEIKAKMAVCTEGAAGSEMYVNGKVTKIPVIKARRTVDNTGAGDAYRAGFYAGKYNGHSDIDSLIIGAATASFAVEETGALSNLPTLDMVMERADRYLGKL